MHLKTKMRFWFACSLFLCISISLVGQGNSSIISNIQHSKNVIDPKTNLAGSYHRVGHMLYAQNLGGVTGLCVQGINSLDGDTNATDLIAAGTTGSGSWRGMQTYYSNTSASLPVMISENDRAVTDMIKFVDPYDNNTDIIYGEMEDYETGRIVRQRGVNPSYSSGVEVNDDGYLITDGVESICIGNLDSDDQLEVAAICLTGVVMGIMNLNSMGSGSQLADFGEYRQNDLRHIKNTITSIDNLDDHGETWQDVVVGHNRNVTAISMNNSRDIIWSIQLSTVIASVLAVPDVNSDNKPEVVASTSDGVYLLNGADGSQLANITNAGSYFRDIIEFNDYNGDSVPEILTGNWEGQLYIWDINTTSGTFGQVIENISTGSSMIWSLLNLGDLNLDSYDEFAYGGNGYTAVILGNNGTKYWGAAANGGNYWLAARSINIYDMTLMNDLDQDGFKDYAVIGGIDLLDSGIFIYSSQGALQFWPDLSGTGTIDTNCSTVDHIFTFSTTVYQAQNLSVNVQVEIDGNPQSMIMNTTTPNWEEGVQFIYQTQLTSGDHIYRFILIDSNNDNVNLPSIGAYNGPHVGSDCDPENNGNNSDNDLNIGIANPFLFGLITIVSIITITSRHRKRIQRERK